MNIMEFINTHCLWQTKDNNRSKENKKQNEELTKELAIKTMQIMALNEFKTKILIKHHIIDWEYKNNNRLVPELEAQKEANRTFNDYKSCGYINKWNNVREDLIKYLQ